MDVGPTFWLASAAVFSAAGLQAAAGMGFGLVATPVLLLALGGREAVQVTILLSLVTSTVLAARLWREADSVLLRRLITGTLLGLPIGIAAYRAIGLQLLRLVAAVFVIGIAVAMCIGPRAGARRPRRSAGVEIGVGAASGVLAAVLAIPGPPPAAWMSRIGLEKRVTRATLLTLFTVSYAAAVVLQVAFGGVPAAVFREAGMLLPAAVLGLLGGSVVGRCLSERVFRGTILVLLLATGVALLLAAL